MVTEIGRRHCGGIVAIRLLGKWEGLCGLKTVFEKGSLKW